MFEKVSIIKKLGFSPLKNEKPNAVKLDWTIIALSGSICFVKIGLYPLFAKSSEKAKQKPKIVKSSKFLIYLFKFFWSSSTKKFF